MKWVVMPKGVSPKSKVQSQKSKVKQQTAKKRQKFPSGVSQKNRKVQQTPYKTLRLSKRIRHKRPSILGAFKLFRLSIRQLKQNWRLFGGIVLVYLVLTVVLVKGFGVSGNVQELKDSLQQVFQGQSGQISGGFVLFGVLLSTANSTVSEVASAYQSMLLVVTSLVLIWTLRQTQAAAKTSVSVRDAFYKSLYPLVPFLLVLLVVGVQLVPLVLANFLYGVVFAGGLAVTVLEQGLWILLLAGLALLSLYMITSSVFALYITTLPNVTPMQALRSARDIVRYRRWLVMRKVLFLPVVMLVLAALIMVPVIIVSPAVAEWLFFILSMVTLAVVHSYMYALYRELLHDA